MKSLRQYFRFMTAVQLLPALESGEDILVGGQAVLEGVMMRSPHAWGIAVRKSSGEMISHSEPLDRPSDKHKWMAWPVIRGVMTLGQAMALGFKALRYSANAVLDENPINEEGKTLQISSWMIAVNAVISLAFFIFMYKFLPLVAATELKRVSPVFGNQFVLNLVDGLIRIALFLLFIWGVSLWSDIRRVYQYHGAEHKTVFAFEAHDPMQPAAVQKYSTFHPRCGTSFLMTVMLISIVVYMLIPIASASHSIHGLRDIFDKVFWIRFGLRIALLPVIAGLSYEIIRFAAKHRESTLFSVMTAPGLWLQRITTKNPSDEQVECAIHALNEAMELEAQRGGELVLA
jgi:uncharacterized protein YqhQ